MTSRFAIGIAVVASAAVGLSACTSNVVGTAPSTTETSTPSTTVPTALTTTSTAGSPSITPPATAMLPGSGACHARTEYGYVLPDPACTPGAVNPHVTQANIGQTICAYGWTRTVRPPVSYTEPLKREQMAEYGDSRPIYDYEEDHLIPLELGGSPADLRNLWPQPGASPNPKDEVESEANRAVCDGQMPLSTAQSRIATDWVAFGRALGIITSPGDQSP